MLIDVKTLVWSHGLASHALCCRRPSSTSCSSSYSCDKVEDNMMEDNIKIKIKVEDIMMEDNININIKVDGNNIETSLHLKPKDDKEIFP